jgi:hypothetical protein
MIKERKKRRINLKVETILACLSNGVFGGIWGNVRNYWPDEIIIIAFDDLG